MAHAEGPLQRAREFIGERYTHPISLRELAVVSGLSRFYLVRSFAQAFGLPPRAYKIRLQCERARVLLEAGHSPADVAVEAGFADQSHLGRHFKRIYRATPGKYRRLRVASVAS